MSHGKDAYQRTATWKTRNPAFPTFPQLRRLLRVLKLRNLSYYLVNGNRGQVRPSSHQNPIGPR